MKNKPTIGAIAFAVVTFFLCLVVIIVSLNGVTRSNSNINTTVITITDPQVKKININTATLAELMTLPGIGEEKATAIIENRPYLDPWELADVPGIGGTTVKKIIELVEV